MRHVMRRKTLWRILLLSMVLAPYCVRFADAAFAQDETAPPVEHLPASVQKTLASLPADTESVVVARSFKIPGSEDKPISDLEPAKAAAEVLQTLATGPISYMKSGEFTGPLAGRKVALAVGAGRRFDVVSAFGEQRYQGCHVLIFEEELAAAGHRMTELLRKKAVDTREIEGCETYVFNSVFAKESFVKDEPWEGVFIVHPRSNVVLCATQEAFLKEVLGRLKVEPTGRALSLQLPVWKYVDGTASAWMVRHVEKNAFAAKHTSACVITLSPAKRNELEIVYVPAGKHSTNVTSRLAKSRWRSPLFTISPQIRQSADGATVVNVSLAGEKKTPPFETSSELPLLLFRSWGDDFSMDGYRKVSR